MMKINSKSDIIQAPDAKIFVMVTDLKKFGEFLPPQVQDWKAEEDFCEFSVAGMVKARVEIVEKVEFSKVVYEIKNDKNLPVRFQIDISGNGEANSAVDVGIEADVPFFLQGMVKEPLQKVADVMATKIKELAERQ
ncbi:MAG: hypothetical protein IJT61_06405 [Bacteroidales bacterium]|nr:hypothetical protein [Bacteroidales bacterium]